VICSLPKSLVRSESLFIFNIQELGDFNSLIKSNPVFKYPLKNYLKERGISENLFSFIDEVTYLNHKTGKEFFGVGLKNINDGWGYRSRNKNGKGNIGKTGVSLIKNNSNVMMVFEGMFDYWSFLTLYSLTPFNNKYSFLILNSTVASKEVKKHVAGIKNVCLYLDNGTSGDLATIQIKEDLEAMNIKCVDKRGTFKGYDDLNDFNLRIKQAERQPRVVKMDGCYNVFYKGKFKKALICDFKELESRMATYRRLIREKESN